MTRTTVFAFFYILIAALTWLPGCFSEASIKKQLAEIKAQLNTAKSDTFPLVWGARFEVPYDTVITYQAVQFTADPASLQDGKECVLDGPGGMQIVGIHDTTAGVMRFTVYREPLIIRGTTVLKTHETFKRKSPPNKIGSSTGLQPQQKTIAAASQVPDVPWWQVAGFTALLLGGIFTIERKFFSR